MTKTYKLPIGPAHVGLKEPVTAWLDIEGERIVDATVRPGAIHRGIEFMSRERNPVQVIFPSRTPRPWKTPPKSRCPCAVSTSVRWCWNWSAFTPTSCG